MQKTIYIPDKAIWEEIQKAAKNEGRSASNYLVNLHRLKSKITNGLENVTEEVAMTPIREQQGVMITTTPNWKNPLENSALAPKK